MRYHRLINENRQFFVRGLVRLVNIKFRNTVVVIAAEPSLSDVQSRTQQNVSGCAGGSVLERNATSVDLRVGGNVHQVLRECPSGPWTMNIFFPT